MSTMVELDTTTKPHGVKLSFSSSTPDLRRFLQHVKPSPHGSVDQLCISTNVKYDASSTQFPLAQKIRRKKYPPSQSELSASSVGDSSSKYYDFNHKGLQPGTNTRQRSTSVDGRTSFIMTDHRSRSPTSAAATSPPTTYPLPLNPPLLRRPLVALHDDTNTSSHRHNHHPHIQEHDSPHRVMSHSTTPPTQLPEFTPFSPAFNSSFYSASPTHFHLHFLASPVSSSPVVSGTASLSRGSLNLSPTPSPSRVAFVNSPRGSIPPAIAPPRRSSLYLAPLASPPSPASNQFSRHVVSSSHHPSTSSLGSGVSPSRVSSVLSLPLSPLSPSIPITPPPEELRRRRMEKLERTLGVFGVGSFVGVGASGSGLEMMLGGDTGKGKGRDREVGSVQGKGIDARDRPPRSDSLSSPSDQPVVVAPWHTIAPPEPSKLKGLTRKLTKSKPSPSPSPFSPNDLTTSDPKSKIKRVPAPIVIVPAPLLNRAQMPSDTRHAAPTSHDTNPENAHENAGEGESGATILTIGPTATILLSPCPSHSPRLPHASSSTPNPSRIHSRSPSPSSSITSSSSSHHADPSPRSRSGSLSSISYAPGSPASLTDSRPPSPLFKDDTIIMRSINDSTTTHANRGRPQKQFGMKRRSRSVSHIYHAPRSPDFITPPVPASPMTPRTARAVNLSQTLKSLDGRGGRSLVDGKGSSSTRALVDGWIKVSGGKLDDEAKARRRRNMDSLGYPLSPRGSSSQTSLVSQRYVKPVGPVVGGSLGSTLMGAIPVSASSTSSTSAPASSVSPSASASTSGSPSASSSTVNLPIRNIPAIPKIQVSGSGQHQKGLKRSTSFSLLRIGRGRRDEGVNEGTNDTATRNQNLTHRHNQSNATPMDAAAEWRAQLEKSKREVLAGFRQPLSHSQPRSSTSTSTSVHGQSLHASPSRHPISRSQPASRTVSRQPSKSDINVSGLGVGVGDATTTRTMGEVEKEMLSYFPAPSPRYEGPFLGVVEGSVSGNTSGNANDNSRINSTTGVDGNTAATATSTAGLLHPSSSTPRESEQYGRIDHRVRGRGWSGEWNLPLEEVIKGLRMM